MSLPYIDGPTIPAGESLSDGVNCEGVFVLRIVTPSGWDKAPLTFQISPDGEVYHDLYHTQPTTSGFVIYESVVPDVEADVIIALPSDTGGPVNWLKIRSGTRDRPIKQKADRAFQLVMDPGRRPAALPGPAGPAGPAGPTGPAGTSSHKGVIDGSAPVAGDVGEFLAAVNLPGLALTTNVTLNVTTLPLPPGDWLVGGIVIFTPVNTGPNSIIAGLSLTAQTMPTDTQVINGNGTATQMWSSSMTSGKAQTLPTGTFRSNSATPVNVYLVANASFGGGSVTVTGRITARRTR